MERYEEYIKPRILKAIRLNGGTATSREIIKISKMKGTVIHRAGDSMKHFGLVKREPIILMENGMPRKINVYTLTKGRVKDIERYINKIPKDWQP